METVTLQAYDTLAEAEIVRGMLQSNGIPAMVTEEHNPYGTLYAQPRVLVFDRDLQQARQLIGNTRATEQPE